MRTITLLAVAAILIGSGCASTPGGGADSPSERITREQLAQTPNESALRVIERLRPQWLNSRGRSSINDPTPQSPSVYLDGSHLGNAEALRQLNTNDIEEIRYWRPGRASARFGMGHLRGVIEIVSRT